MTKNKVNKHKILKKALSDTGSAFFYILLGVVLFATLAFTISRGFKGTSTNAMTDRQAELVAAEILNYAQNISHAINKIRRNGCSENDISFDHTGWGHTEYQHSPITSDKCKVFHPNGGNAAFIELNGHNKKYLDYANRVIFVGASEINNIGATCGDSSCTELYLFIRMFHAENLCKKLNNMLQITPELPISGGIYGTPRFKGVFSYGNTLTTSAFNKKIGGCYQDNSEIYTDGTPYYDFYYVLIER
tara:strand:+ start:335 stop:1075 length:741 start_codon:yes stop_codon:yes gene_type:complete